MEINLNGRCASAIINTKGFTLLELLVALVVGIVVIGAVYAVYVVQLRVYRNQQLELDIQQNLRGAMVILEEQIRLAGYDPDHTGRFGITDVRRYDLIGTGTQSDGQPALFYTVDVDEDGLPDPRNHFRNREHCNFRMRLDQSSGRRYLAWDNGGGRQALAGNIQAIGLAYAIDSDRDGQLDTWSGGIHLIWAVDSDNDNLLDTHLDANDDGRIDENDDTDGDGRITAGDGGRLDPPVPLDRIRAVQVWLLGVSSEPLQGRINHQCDVVGDRIMKQPDDRFKRMVLRAIIECRNL